jgi:hypothetical protein
MRDFQSEELQLESNLSFLSADQQLDNQSRIAALGRLGQLDALNAVNAGLSNLVLDDIKSLHLHVDRAARSEETKQMIATERQYLGPCVKNVRVEF